MAEYADDLINGSILSEGFDYTERHTERTQGGKTIWYGYYIEELKKRCGVE